MTEPRDNETWLRDLQGGGTTQADALETLRALLMRQLPMGLSRFLPPSHPSFSSLLEDTVQETLVRVLNKLDTFEGRSQFTTWAYKIAIHLALNELRRKRWHNVSIDALDGEPDEGQPLLDVLAAEAPGPEKSAEQKAMMDFLEVIIREELTSRQQAAIRAVSFEDVPMEEVARRLGTNRNALYKLIHDGRVRLKRRLEQEGLSAEDLMALFSQGQ